MSNGELQDSHHRRDIYDAQPYHMEKYVVPGAVAVVLLYLLPWYWLGGIGLGGVDLGTAVILGLVLGHLIESLKMYQWGSKVRRNFAEFNDQVSGLLAAHNVSDDDRHTKRERAKSILFTVVGEGEGSEFAWNLVRWQKMTVIAALLKISALLWVAFAFLVLVSDGWSSPFRTSFRAAILKDTLSVWWSVLAHAVAATILWVGARYIYKFGLQRQRRTNESYYLLIQRYWSHILDSLNNANAKLDPELGDAS